MELTGKLVRVLEPQTITKKDGSTMTKRGIVIETEGQYKKQIAISIINNNINIPDLGAEVSVKFDILSREYNSRWYTEVTAWSISSFSSTKKPHPVIQGSASPLNDENTDDLPF